MSIKDIIFVMMYTVVTLSTVTALSSSPSLSSVECSGPAFFNGDLAATFSSCCTKYGPSPHKRVIIPSGDWYITPPLPLLLPCDNLEVHLEADTSHISAPSVIKDWSTATYAMGATHRQNVSITGSGVINGRGQVWWQNCSVHRPFLLQWDHCNGVSVEGITLTDSPMFHLVGQSCTNVHIDSITINAPYTNKSCNLDGIDFSKLLIITMFSSTYTHLCIHLRSLILSVIIL
jgi:polygalacturonase